VAKLEALLLARAATKSPKGWFCNDLVALVGNVHNSICAHQANVQQQRDQREQPGDVKPFKGEDDECQVVDIVLPKGGGPLYVLPPTATVGGGGGLLDMPSLIPTPNGAVYQTAGPLSNHEQLGGDTVEETNPFADF
jgi:hypothetical protein